MSQKAESMSRGFMATLLAQRWGKPRVNVNLKNKVSNIQHLMFSLIFYSVQLFVSILFKNFDFLGLISWFCPSQKKLKGCFLYFSFSLTLQLFTDGKNNPANDSNSNNQEGENDVFKSQCNSFRLFFDAACEHRIWNPLAFHVLQNSPFLHFANLLERSAI